MGILDIVLLLCFVPAIVKGFTKGFVIQIVNLAAILLGAFSALRFSNVLTTWLSGYVTWDKSIVYVVSFFLIVLIVIFLINLLGRLVTAAMGAISIGWLNRLLGVLFGIIKTVVLLAIPVMIFQNLNAQFNIVDPAKLDGSPVYNFIVEVANTVFPYFKSILSGFTTADV